MRTLFYRQGRLTALAILVLVAAGASAFLTIGRQEDPTITNIFANIFTPYPGADPARVEALVTEKVEAELREIAQIKRITSTSSTGISVINVELSEFLDDAAIDARLPRLFERYLAGLEAGLPADPMAVLPGVPDLMDALEGTGDVALALLTGNIEDGARLKLAGSGLAERFVTGSFGSDREFRDDLPPVAMERAAATWGVTFAATEVFVIGDTPRDVACGQAHGTRTVAVATGRFDAQVLERTGATHVVPDFSDTQRVFELLTA